MKIALWRFYDRMKVANKMASQYRASYGTIDATLREPCDVIDPVFTIEVNTTYSGEDTSEETLPYLRANYLSMQWGSEKVRYYYILKKVVLSSSLVELHCHEDVVTTWWDVIKNSTGVISRCSNVTANEKYIIDDLYLATGQTYSDTFTATGQLPWNGALNSHYCICLSITGVDGNSNMNRYLVTPNQFMNISKNLVTTDFSNSSLKITNPVNLISAAYMFPINLQPYVNSSQEDILLAGVNIGTGRRIVSNDETSGSIISVGGQSIQYNNILYNDFRDFPPYTSYELYLPFLGVVPIDIEKFVLNNTYYNFYYNTIIDLNTGDAMHVVSTNTNEIIYTFNISLGIRIPILSSNYTQQKLNQQALDVQHRNFIDSQNVALVGSVGSLILVAAGIAAAPITGGASAVASAALLAGSATNAIKTAQSFQLEQNSYNMQSKLNSMISVGSSPISGNVGWGINWNAFLRRYTRKFPDNFPSSNIGYKCFRSATPSSITTSSLSTYAEFADININGSDATYNEVSEMRRLMSGGLYY